MTAEGSSNMVVSLAELRLPVIVSLLCGFGACSVREARVFGLRLEDGGQQVFMRQRTIVAPRNTVFRIRLFGSYLSNDSWPWVAFAAAKAGSVDPCGPEENRKNTAFQVNGGFVSDEENSGFLEVHTEAEKKDAGFHHLCVLKGQSWESVGSDQLLVQDPDVASDYIPRWGLVLVVALLVLICAVVRCLNLSLLWLDPLELYVLHSCGSEDEKHAAKRLKPIRRRGNVLVCSLLFLCALGQSVLGVFLYRLYESILPAVFTSAFLLFLLAELLPYVICSGYGFEMAPGLIWLAQICLIITCPLSCPLGLLLDLILGRDVSTCGIREKTMEMIRTSVNDPYNEFVKVEFSKGALRTKTVEDILTPLKDCFMLPSTAVLDFSTMSEIMQSGYTRVPVYEEEKSNIVEILYVKDLALVDPEDRTPMTTITKFYNHPLHFVFNDTKLDAMLEEFKKGNSHLAIVQKVNNEGEGDPFYEVLGLVTLEDVIEEIIKSEILDESDLYTDNRNRKKVDPNKNKRDFSAFKHERESKVKISPQLMLAAHRFLATEVSAFSPLQISDKVLLRILKHPDVIQEIKFNDNDKRSQHHYLYQRGKHVDFFVLILQGRVEVEAGNENMRFETGPFSYYGVMALSAPSLELRSPSHLSVLNRSASLSCTERVDSSVSISGSSSQIYSSAPAPQYTPDFNVRALTDLQYAKITRSQYQNGLLASRLDSTPQSPESSHTHLDHASDSAQPPPLTPPTSTNHSTATPRDGRLDENTSLLNDRNSLTKRRSSHAHPHLNTNHNCSSSPAPRPHSNSSPTPRPHAHTFTHAHTESTI
nr:metal transporter CNNM4 isoform X2 [Danio rerio]|eukprot:XP_021326668.1 metal transporter CNNM4 isoform X2 [Danio rerio]